MSSYGIREGLLYEQMPQRLRDRDPLIEACRFAEAKDARMPGFGRALFHFVMPLFKSAPESQRRLIKAACLLHDVSWRAHPDYRAEVCFDNATRANLGGLKHSERVFLGLALLHRYSNKREGTRFEDLFGLLPEKGQKQAEILGKAMRFGAMLWMDETRQMGALRWYPEETAPGPGADPAGHAALWRGGRSAVHGAGRRLAGRGLGHHRGRLRRAGRLRGRSGLRAARPTSAAPARPASRVRFRASCG